MHSISKCWQKLNVVFLVAIMKLQNIIYNIIIYFVSCFDLYEGGGGGIKTICLESSKLSSYYKIIVQMLLFWWFPLRTRWGGWDTNADWCIWDDIYVSYCDFLGNIFFILYTFLSCANKRSFKISSRIFVRIFLFTNFEILLHFFFTFFFSFKFHATLLVWSMCFSLYYLFQICKFNLSNTFVSCFFLNKTFLFHTVFLASFVFVVFCLNRFPFSFSTKIFFCSSKKLWFSSEFCEWSAERPKPRFPTQESSWSHNVLCLCLVQL